MSYHWWALHWTSNPSFENGAGPAHVPAVAGTALDSEPNAAAGSTAPEDAATRHFARKLVLAVSATKPFRGQTPSERRRTAIPMPKMSKHTEALVEMRRSPSAVMKFAAMKQDPQASAPP